MTESSFILSPSLLSCDFGRLAEELEALDQAGLSWVHWDVMDGHFVPNITLGPPVIAKCRPLSRLFFDVHLMIQQPERYLESFAKAGADLITVHVEACTHLESVVSRIEELGAKPAVSLNPHTPLCHLDYILPRLHLVLIMSVNPGFGGQRFIPFCYDKIADLAALIRSKGCDTLIEVDGGVSLENAGRIAACGANVLVSGSEFFGYPPYEERHRLFLEAAEKAAP